MRVFVLFKVWFGRIESAIIDRTFAETKNTNVCVTLALPQKLQTLVTIISSRAIPSAPLEITICKDNTNMKMPHKKIPNQTVRDSIAIKLFFNYLQAQRGFSCLKKSLPLSSTKMKAGKSSTSIFQMASIPSSGYSTHSMLLMLFCAKMAAGPPIEPR